MSEEQIVTQTETPVVQPDVVTEPIVEQPITEYEIDGKKVSIDEIRDWQRGNMRQSDYTRKTQELANQRKEAQDAVELYEYLKANPKVAKRLKEADDESGDLDSVIEKQVEQLSPEMQRILSLERQVAMDALDKEINDLTRKYPDFDEVKVLNEAKRLKLNDLEFVYKSLRNVDQIDVEKIRADAIEQAKKELMEQMSNNTNATATIVDTTAKPVTQNPVEGTDAEKRVAEAMGMTIEEYKKWQ